MKDFSKLMLAASALLVSGAAAHSAPAQATAPATAHAYQMGSSANRWGFVEFPANDISALQIVKSTSSDGSHISAGEYVNGKLYTYTVYIDMLYGQGVEPDAFVVYNPETFTEQTHIDTAGIGRVVDMTYDYTHNTMYALVEKSAADNGLGLTALNVVDLTTGALTEVGEPGDIKAQNGYGNTVAEHLVALASDPADGTLYAMGEYRQLYRLDRMTGKATAVGQRNKVAIKNDFQSMAFDADGNLYQVQCHPDYEYFMQIDPATGALTNPVTGQPVTVNSDFTNNAARFENDPQLTALYFDGKTYNGDVPAAVQNLSASIVPGTSNDVHITWTAPRAAVTGYTIYRFGTAEPIATLGASATEYTDIAAPNGDISYYVVANDGQASGFPAWTTLFAGADQLKAVTDLTASLDGDNVTLSWTAPTETVNGGYADYNNITYIIKKTKGSESEVIVDNHAATSFNTTLTADGTYTFTVIPVTCGVEGLPATSNEVTKQGVAQLPYSCGFGDADGGTLWTFENNGTSTSYGWSIISGYEYQQLDGKFAQFKTGGSATIPANDWMYSPEIECPAGEYAISYFVNGGSYDTHTYKVFIIDADNNRTEIYSIADTKIYGEDSSNNNFVPVNITFNLPEDGIYRVGFQGIGCAIYATLRFDNFAMDCTLESSVNDIAGNGSRLIYDSATRTVRCNDAISIEAYDISGAKIGSAAGDGLVIAADGIVIVKATTPAGTVVRKIAVR